MKTTDRAILFVLPALALFGAFWFLILSPKRDEAKSLEDDIAALQTSISTAEQTVTQGELAREAFSDNYEALVAYGKAAPEGGDQSSLIYDMTEISAAHDVSLERLQLTQATGEAPPPPTTPAETSEARVDAVDGEGTTTAPPATEATAAVLPLGASVGAAGLPVMPYDFTFQGSFFDLSDFFAAIDRQVRVVDGEPRVRGRLMTIDSFSVSVGDDFPELDAEVSTTTYLVPSDQGVVAGATSTGPAPVAPAAPPAAATNVPASTPVAP